MSFHQSLADLSLNEHKPKYLRDNQPSEASPPTHSDTSSSASPTQTPEMFADVSPEIQARIQAIHMSRMGRDRAHSSPPEQDDHKDDKELSAPWQSPKRPNVATDFASQRNGEHSSPEVSPFTIASSASKSGFQGYSGSPNFHPGSLPKSFTKGGPLTGPITGSITGPSRQSSLSSRRGMRLTGSPLISDDEANNERSASADSRSREGSGGALTGGLTGPVPNGARLPGRLSSQNSIKRKGPGKLSLGGSPNPSTGETTPQPSNNDSADSSASGGLFAQFSKIVDISTGSLNFAGKASLHSEGIDFSGGSSFRINIDELEPLGELGRGNYGTVTKVLHKPTGVTMAMKEVKLELDKAKFAQIIMELDILHKCASPYIVDFFGAFFVEGAVYECIEYMDGGSLDKVYEGGVDEPYLAVITDSVVRGLKFLKEEHNIIHRDVKPTNILINTAGKVKLCDFGVSGNLVASKASTVIGCQSYMAPERIHNPESGNVTYTANSDIWSLGVSILEIAQGSYPYPPEAYMSVFAQLRAIVSGDPPQLGERFSSEARDFVSQCLQKKPYQRPTYQQLLEHPWLAKFQGVDVGMAEFVKTALERRSSVSTTPAEKPVSRTPVSPVTSRYGSRPALHHTIDRQ